MDIKGLGKLGFHISQPWQTQYQVKQAASNVYLLAKKKAPIKYLKSQLQKIQVCHISLECPENERPRYGIEFQPRSSSCWILDTPPTNILHSEFSALELHMIGKEPPDISGI